MKKLSIVVPCFNEQQVVTIFHKELLKYVKDNYEIIFVDDGSKDNTLNELKDLKQQNPNIKILSFSRNFGKEAAMYAGLKHAKGDYVCIMDTDLQDPPHLLPEMLNILNNEDFDCVATYRSNRKGEPKIRSFFARSFYKIINKMIDVEVVDGARDYRVMKRPMVDSILSLCEVQRFSKGIFSWVGYNVKYLQYQNIERVKGETKWSFFKLFKYAIEGIVSFTTFPLRIATLTGIFTSFIGFLYLAYIIMKALIFGDPVAGYPSLICVIVLLGGIQLLALGIIGEYLAKTYIEVKKRPIYIIKEKID